MAIDNVATRNALVDYFTSISPYGALFSTAPSGGSAGTELTGGSPAYARKPITWPAAASGASTGSTLTFDVPSGATVAGFGYYSALTAGTYRAGVGLTTQTFASQGQYQVVPAYAQS